MKTESTQYYLKKINEYGRKQEDVKFDSMKPHQQIGVSIRKVMKELETINKKLNTAIKIKQETGTPTNKYWVWTKNSFVKLENKMSKIKHKLRNLQT